MTLAEAIGQVVRAHRKRQGWTQKQLAGRVDMHRPNVVRLERGKGWRKEGNPQVPRVETLERVGAAFKLSASELLYEAEVLWRMGGEHE